MSTAWKTTLADIGAGSSFTCQRNTVSAEAIAQAQHFIGEALKVAYKDDPIPTEAYELLASQEKPGRVCALFFHGRSGSFFAQSFFDSGQHPEVVTAHPAALGWIDSAIKPEELKRFNKGELTPGPVLGKWCHDIIQRMAPAFTPHSLDLQFDELCVSETVFSALVYAQLLLLAPGNMTYEALLKICMLAYRFSSGSNLACDKPLIYLWQAHVPNIERKRWIKRTFKESYLLTIVRFPEKALDSHLLYHSSEAVSPPLSTLLHRLLIQHMAVDAELIDFPDDGRERLIRFEDLHHRTECVLQAICRWFQIPYCEKLVKNDFSMLVRGQKINGTRTLKRSEYRAKLLNHFDCLRIRALLEQDYREWGYASQCEPDLTASLDEYTRDHAASSFPFAAHVALAGLAKESQQQINAETARLEKDFLHQLERRKAGIKLVPMLYSLE